MDGKAPKFRLDVWLDVASLFKTRTEAQKACRGGKVDDFVLWRWDDTPAYNLAVMVDDAAQGIEQVVRGDDLVDSTPRQLLLYRLLGLPEPLAPASPDGRGAGT